MTGKLRLLAVTILIVALVPGLWWRDKAHLKADRSGDLTITQIAGAAPGGGAVRLEGVWQLTGRDTRLGGYSALNILQAGIARAQSDNARWLEFALPGSGGTQHRYGKLRPRRDKLSNDVEAETRDPSTGTTWYSLEMSNSIRRFSPEGVLEAQVAPPEMAHFPANGGAESLARLPDGRFLAIRETGDWLNVTARQALLFAGDPVTHPHPISFVLNAPLGFDPSDAIALPDGRVLILLRALRPGPHGIFSSRILIADPADIRRGKVWPSRELVDLDDLVPRENYEGIAAVPVAGKTVLWLISDNNSSVALQRTLLVKLIWNECTAAKAAECRTIRPRQRLS